MPAPREWPSHMANVRDDTADLIVSAKKELMAFVRRNRIENNPELMGIILNLQQAETLLVYAGAEIRPEPL